MVSSVAVRCLCHRSLDLNYFCLCCFFSLWPIDSRKTKQVWFVFSIYKLTVATVFYEYLLCLTCIKTSHKHQNKIPNSSLRICGSTIDFPKPGKSRGGRLKTVAAGMQSSVIHVSWGLLYGESAPLWNQHFEEEEEVCCWSQGQTDSKSQPSCSSVSGYFSLTELPDAQKTASDKGFREKPMKRHLSSTRLSLCL